MNYKLTRYIFLAVTLTIFAGKPVLAAEKLDPFISVMQRLDVQTSPATKSLPATTYVDVFIKSSDTARTVKSIESVGGEARTVTGTIITASLPAHILGAVQSWEEVLYVEASKPLFSKNDLAGTDTGATDVRSGLDLPIGFDGAGVIVGVIDSGIELGHPAFNDADRESRVWYLWDQQTGEDYNHYEIISGRAESEDQSGHGTHVAATAAGLDTFYPGVAPSSGLVIVKVKEEEYVRDVMRNAFSTDVCDGANYIFEKANGMAMPAVINISLGTSIGPHDGTTLFEQCLNELVSAEKGRSIVVAAGNPGKAVGGGHVSFSVDPAENVAVGVYAAGESPLLYVDLWKAATCSFDVKFRLWETGVGMIDETPWVPPTTVQTGTLGGAPYEISNGSEADPRNGKVNAYIALFPTASIDPAHNFFDMVFSGSCAVVNAWTFPDYFAQFGTDEGVFGGIRYVPGNNGSTVEAPATAEKIIAVGAYVTRTGWTTKEGVSQSDPMGLLADAGELAPFSARGPSISGAVKPNVSGPGAYIISAMSYDAPPGGAYIPDPDHAVMSGTSMASPHVAGIVALLLEAAPHLTYDEIMNYIESTARMDPIAGTAPDDNWGHGKVDALAAVSDYVARYPGITYNKDRTGIFLSRINAGSLHVPQDTKKISIIFGRPPSSSTSDGVYVARIPYEFAAPMVDENIEWSSALCDPVNKVDSWSSNWRENNYELEFREPLGHGLFAFCVSPEMRDADGIKYGGKTIKFSTTGFAQYSASEDEGSGGGCALLGGTTASPLASSFIIAMLTTLFTIKRRSI